MVGSRYWRRTRIEWLLSENAGVPCGSMPVRRIRQQSAEAVSKRTHQSEVFEIGLREAPTTASAGGGKAKAPPQNLVILSFDTASARSGRCRNLEAERGRHATISSRNHPAAHEPSEDNTLLISRVPAVSGNLR